MALLLRHADQGGRGGGEEARREAAGQRRRYQGPHGRGVHQIALRLALATLFATVFPWLPARADPPDERGKTLAAQRAAAPPVIDGRLDDAAWAGATPDRRFTQNFPNQGRPPSQPTDLYVLYDDRALYIGLRCHDAQPELIVERLTRRDRDTDADKVIIDIDSRHDGASAYHFDLNVSGVLADGLRFNDLEYNGDWDGLWIGMTTRDPGGWSAEIEIPWRTLRFAGADPVMGLQVRRYIQRRGETDAWAYIPRTARGEVSRYGSLENLRGLSPSRLFQLIPFVRGRLASVSYSGAADGETVDPSAGIDLKLGLTSSLTLDASINPDFGQVEADQVQLNLTTFEIFYPEKRPFFLEGVDLFATPIQQFYTRRVGRAPPAASTYYDETILESPATGRIWGATKISGQLVPHLSIAALDAVTAEQTALVQPAGGGPRERRLVDPTANYAILRGRFDFGQSYVGVTGTSVNRFESGAPEKVLCPGDVAPEGGRCTHDAYSASADARLSTRDGTWRAVGQVAVSRIEHGPARTLPDGTIVKSGDTGVGVSVNGGKAGGDHFLFNLRYLGFSPGFDINDAGYVRRANDQQFVPVLTLRSTRPIGPTLESSASLWAAAEYSWDTRVRLWSEAGLNAWMRFKSFWQLFVEVAYHLDRFDNRETRDGAIFQRAAGWFGYLNVESDSRKRVRGGIDLWAARVLHGFSYGGELRVALRPLPQIELDVIPRADFTYGDPRWTGRTDDLGADGRRYWFGDLASQTVSVTMRGTYTFTPRLTLQLYAQLFLAGYHYDQFVAATAQRRADGTYQLPFDSFFAAPTLGREYDYREGALNVNVVLRWEYLPGSTVIAVYTRSQGQIDYTTAEGDGVLRFGPFRNGPATDIFLLKISYLWS